MFKKRLLCLFLLINLAACGQTGSLYLPQEQQTDQPDVSQPDVNKTQKNGNQQEQTR